MSLTYSKTSRSADKFPVLEFVVLFAPVMLLIIVAGFYMVHVRTESQLGTLIDDDSMKLSQMSGFLGEHLNRAFNHLQSIYDEAETQNAINSDNTDALRSLEKSLLILARRNYVYDQVRWIDETGMEKIRITRGKEGPYLEPPDNLQDKSQRYYFKAANSLLPGELYASKIDLNVEHGKIELPRKPMLRIATPLVDAGGNRRGIIIINLLMKPIFETLHYLEQEGQGGNYILLNEQAELIHGNIDSHVINGGNQRPANFSTAYPAIWKRIADTESGYLEAGYGLWTWKRISSFDNLSGFVPYTTAGIPGMTRRIHGDFSLIFVVERPMGFLLEMHRNIRVTTFIGVLALLVVYGISLFFYLKGNFRAKHAELEAIYARAHAANMTRLKEQEERFHRLVESSSIGQLVVDSEGKIEISNATVEQMLGYTKSELIGASVERLLPADKRQAHLAFRSEFMRKPRPRKMGEGRELQALRKDGTAIPVEVGLNPYTDQDRILVLVNIIELNKR